MEALVNTAGKDLDFGIHFAPGMPEETTQRWAGGVTREGNTRILAVLSLGRAGSLQGKFFSLQPPALAVTEKAGLTQRNSEMARAGSHCFEFPVSSEITTKSSQFGLAPALGPTQVMQTLHEKSFPLTWARHGPALRVTLLWAGGWTRHF